MTSESEPGPSIRRLHQAVLLRPSSVWGELLQYLRDHPGELTSIDLLEDLIFHHGDEYVGDIELAALAEDAIEETVLAAHVGGVASEGAERFARLQAALVRAKDKSPDDERTY